MKNTLATSAKAILIALSLCVSGCGGNFELRTLQGRPRHAIYSLPVPFVVRVNLTDGTMCAVGEDAYAIGCSSNGFDCTGVVFACEHTK